MEDDNGWYPYPMTTMMKPMGYNTFGFDEYSELLNGDENNFIMQSSDHSSLSDDNNLCLESPHHDPSIWNEQFHDVLLSFTNEGAADISYWY